ncbi:MULTISPECIES: DUF3169 family protein [Staphylococcus]|uniref:DUF3169 family protein n=1 Tax=Staphylococcus TaxID=1279 RepID=UPI0008A545EF|nr:MULTISPECIES: DUF3169 family protein [Staphylococcus]MCI2791564.1 DUF3169 family protein [Staphylococcus pettenkoferi]OFK76624.1 hypothetical protein HMPREF2802_10385 [Staphylococcus sp. HMSC071G07]
MKVGRYIGLIILGCFIGGIIGGVIGVAQNFNIKRLLLFVDFKNSIIITAISLVLILILGIFAFKYARKAYFYKNALEKDISEDNVDTYEQKSNIQFLEAQKLLLASYVIAFLNLFIIVLGHGSIEVYFIALIPFFVVVIWGTINGVYARKLDSRMPKFGDKNYTEKRLSVMDEGERHITLKSLFKVNAVTLSLVIVGLLFLYFYSMATGDNQSIGMLVLIIIFIYNSLTYTFKVAKYYKN